MTAPNMGDNVKKLKFLHGAVVQLGCSVVSDSLQPHGLQHARLPCSLPDPGICSNSCPLSRWCHPTISSSVVSFSSCLFQWVCSSDQVAKVLEFQLQHQSFHTAVEDVKHTQTHTYTHTFTMQDSWPLTEFEHASAVCTNHSTCT